MTERVGGVVDWLVYDLKIPYGPAATQYPDHSANRQLGVQGRSVNYLNLMKGKFLDMGGKLMLETRAEELLRDNAGRVVGVRAKDAQGNSRADVQVRDSRLGRLRRSEEHAPEGDEQLRLLRP